MAHLIYNRDEILAAWAAKRIPHVRDEGFGQCKAVGVATGPTAQDRLMAVCVYHTYSETYATCQISMAACNPGWARRDIFRSLLSFPFLQYKVWKVWTATPHDAERTIRLNQAIGFTKEAVLADQYGRGSHAVICRMRWPDYKKLYLPKWDDGRAALMNQMVN